MFSNGWQRAPNQATDSIRDRFNFNESENAALAPLKRHCREHQSHGQYQLPIGGVSLAADATDR